MLAVISFTDLRQLQRVRGAQGVTARFLQATEELRHVLFDAAG